jgi:hypothetical protein
MKNALDYLGLVTDRTAADVQKRTKKGVYNADDMNRVSEAVDVLRPFFRDFGYAVGEAEIRVWAENELPRLSEAEEFLAAVRALDGRFRYAENMIELPETMRRLTYTGANNIEKFLAAMPEVFGRMASAWYFADELFCGEV